MKLILSRKGFDSSYGGVPSIILPDGTMISFPIPVKAPEKGIAASEIVYRRTGKSLNDYLSGKSFEGHHVDPEVQDLYVGGIRLNDGKFGTLGQCSSALGHLKNKGILRAINAGEEVVFLFWGWFCHVDENLNRKGQPFHAIWGYLKATEVIPVGDGKTVPEELKNHPHVMNANHPEYLKGGNNMIFRGTEFGTFRFDERLRLTEPEKNLTCWVLPACIQKLSYNSNLTDAKANEDGKKHFQSAPRGQEYIVLEADEPALKEWVDALISDLKV